MKKIFAALICVTMILAMSLTAFAGTWEKDARGWKWKNDDGTYAVKGWKWIDGNNDGKAECYYFSDTGYAVTSTRTPDGYYVNADGAWVVNNVVQTKEVLKVAATADSTATTGPTAAATTANTDSSVGPTSSTTTSSSRAVSGPTGGKTSSWLDPYVATLQYQGVDGTERAIFSANGDMINVTVISGKTSGQLTPAQAESMYYGDSHYEYMQKMLNQLMHNLGESIDLTETVTTSDGQTVYQYTYYGMPF